MRGKYSPTVNSAYSASQDWWNQSSKDGIYDEEGFDSYGYNHLGVDRAGNREEDYYANDNDFDGDNEDDVLNKWFDDDFNFKYDDALNKWKFNGKLPVQS